MDWDLPDSPDPDLPGASTATTTIDTIGFNVRSELKDSKGKVHSNDTRIKRDRVRFNGRSSKAHATSHVCGRLCARGLYYHKLIKLQAGFHD